MKIAISFPLLLLACTCAAQQTYVFNLTNQAFANPHPGALVFVPSTFNKASTRLRLLVFIHGFENCVVNCVKPNAQTGPCTPGQPKRSGYSILAQIEDAKVSANTLLVVPEVAYDQRSSDAGKFGQQGGFARFLEELFAEKMAPFIGVHHIQDIERIRLFSHSGAYLVAGRMAMIGGVPVQDINLLDSLYGDFPDFDGFVQNNINRFGPGASDYRFSVTYTDNGGTDANSRSMALRAKTWVERAGKQDRFLYDDTTATLPPAAYQHAIIFKHSSLSHDDVPRYYFGQLIRNAQ